MKKRIYELDFIRAIAVLIIIFYHYLESGILSFGLMRNPEAFSFHGISLLHFGGINLTLGNWGVSLFLIISGASLMYVYEDELKVITFYKKRIRAIFPLYYLAFGFAFIIQIAICGGLWTNASGWTIILTFLGLDGWIADVIPNFALVGDWFVGCILIIYLLFPLFYKCLKRHPDITVLLYAIIFLIWEFWFPFDFTKRNSIILRGFEVLLGMYFIKKWRKVSFRTFLFSCVVIAVLLFIKINFVSLYILVPVAGMSAFLVLYYLAGHMKAKWIQRPIQWLSYYSYAIFLMHHFILNRIFEKLAPASMGVVGVLVLFVVIMALVLTAGYLLKKLEIFIYQLCRACKKRILNKSA